MLATEDQTNAEPKPETKEWTLMFYFASDNPLAISIVSQLKAIKAAGFHHNANVIVQFDPYTEGTPTHIFDVNTVNKAKQEEPNIGFEGEEPFVPTLIEDKLWRNETGDSGEAIRDVIKRIMKRRHLEYKARIAPDLNGNGDAPPTDENATSKTVETKGAATFNIPPNTGQANGGSNGNKVKGSRRKRLKRQEPNPLNSLQEFLEFCRREYPARHYMLFILGHGVVVGNDIFLYDEHADQHTISLGDMGDTLEAFKDEIRTKNATFELVSFHSCSVSSLEVAYQLRNTANYFLASEGPTFVGSWPYRQILMRIFLDLMEDPTDDQIRATMREIFTYCLQNSDDYLLAGYSYQLTLCDLRNIDTLDEKLQKLSNALSDALSAEDAESTFAVLYSHWKAQSFFQEMYTDLYDFCFCIDERCKRITEMEKRKISGPLDKIWTACRELIGVLKKPVDEKDERNETGFVLAADFKGPAYQYSRGLCVYFPWSRPSVDSEIMEQYEEYTFHTAFHSKPEEQGPPRKSWKDFLDVYFAATQRVPRGTELLWELPTTAEKRASFKRDPNDEKVLEEDVRSLVYSGEGPLGGSLAKDDPRDRTGDECSCPSFKNYPRDTRARKDRKKEVKLIPPNVRLSEAAKAT